MHGYIVQISVSVGGVPKLAIPAGEVTPGGLVGDRQKTPNIHGGPDRALCLWSQGVIEQLQAEGHPIEPGCAGENITIAGLDWSQVTPGSRLRLGAEVMVEITDYVTPCYQIKRYFHDRRYSRISQHHYPGSSRLYARVLSPGSLRPGDLVSWLAPVNPR